MLHCTVITVMITLLQLNYCCCDEVKLHNHEEDPLGIVNGVEARKDAYPWMVRLERIFYNGTHDIIGSCGGTLVDKQHVLSAAHCKYDSPMATVTAHIGSHHIDESRYTISVIGVKNHPNFDGYNSLKNDITLLRLQTPVPDDYPLVDYTAGEIHDCYTRRKSKIMGWGVTKHGNRTSNSEVLLEINNVEITPDRKQCMNEDSQTQCPHKTQICAQDPDHLEDSANGDSGGPLLIKKNDKLVNLGIVSYGDNVNGAMYPACYTCVPAYKDWIQEQIALPDW